MNNDGYADLLIGEYTSSAGAALAGRTRIYSGRTGAVLRTITSTNNGQNLGFDAVGIGDVNGDSVIDLMISAASANRVYVVEGIAIICPELNPADPEPAAPDYNRYLSFEGGNAGFSTALRVTLNSLDGLPGFNGQTRWAGPPTNAPDGSAAASTIRVAALKCTPHYRDWSTEGTVYLYGAEVVPGSTYGLQSIDEECDPGDEASYSDALALTTQAWGDTVAPFGGIGQPDFGDISAIVDAFKQSATAVLRPQSQLQPNVLDPTADINFADITADVDAFKGNPYAYAGPSACP